MQASLRSSYHQQPQYYEYSGPITTETSPQSSQDVCLVPTPRLHADELAIIEDNHQHVNDQSQAPKGVESYGQAPCYAMLLPGEPTGLTDHNSGAVTQSIQTDQAAHTIDYAAVAANELPADVYSRISNNPVDLYQEQHQVMGAQTTMYYQDYQLSAEPQADLNLHHHHHQQQQRHQVKVIELQESYHQAHEIYEPTGATCRPSDSNTTPSASVDYQLVEPSYADCQFAVPQPVLTNCPTQTQHLYQSHSGHLQPYRQLYNTGGYYNIASAQDSELRQQSHEQQQQQDTSCYHSLNRASYYETTTQQQHLEEAHFYHHDQQEQEQQQNHQIDYQQLEESRKQHEETGSGHLLIGNQQQELRHNVELNRPQVVLRSTQIQRNSINSSGSSTCSSGGGSKVSQEDEEDEDEEDDEEEEEEEEENEEERRRAEDDDEEDEDDDDEDSTMTRDERKAREAGIPLSYHEIVNLSIDQFNDHIARFQYSESQLTLMKDIRRRGKNKVAAQTCRKRKMEQIVELQREVGRLASKRMALSCDLNHLLQEHLRRANEYERLYSAIQAHMAQGQKLASCTAPTEEQVNSLSLTCSGVGDEGVTQCV